MRYVILKHSHINNPTHWDMMLEQDRILKTWRVEIGPDSFSADERIKIIAIQDHLAKFLEYQGPVNKGLGRVETADKGHCQIVKQDADGMTIVFKGQLLTGEFSFFFAE